MPSILVSAVLSAFFATRLLKGAWVRNPQYLALSMVGSLAGILVLHSGWPQFDDGFVVPNAVSLAGAFVAVFAFDRAIGAN